MGCVVRIDRLQFLVERDDAFVKVTGLGRHDGQVDAHVAPTADQATVDQATPSYRRTTRPADRDMPRSIVRPVPSTPTACSHQPQSARRAVGHRRAGSVVELEVALLRERDDLPWATGVGCHRCYQAGQFVECWPIGSVGDNAADEDVFRGGCNTEGGWNRQALALVIHDRGYVGVVLSSAVRGALTDKSGRPPALGS